MSFAYYSRLLAAAVATLAMCVSAADIRRFRGGEAVLSTPKSVADTGSNDIGSNVGVAHGNASAVVRVKMPTSTGIPGGAVISYRTDTHHDAEAAWQSADKAQDHLEQARRSLEVSQDVVNVVEKASERIETNAAKITHLYKPHSKAEVENVTAAPKQSFARRFASCTVVAIVASLLPFSLA
eukprot:TRINITY_DN5746_c0_g1_i1.p1 TRINITY_DN5746_c0_g1~~TRINITY_DN5746_c0_g1_i1.p1  ORF type:complete len:201 (+),score=41.07 TRINITY_DN5746_c0_g1_i1:59-604(+)